MESIRPSYIIFYVEASDKKNKTNHLFYLINLHAVPHKDSSSPEF